MIKGIYELFLGGFGFFFDTLPYTALVAGIALLALGFVSKNDTLKSFGIFLAVTGGFTVALFGLFPPEGATGAADRKCVL